MHSEGSSKQCLLGGIAAGLSQKMVELLLEDGQIAAVVSDDITATVANLRRTSSCGFGLCCRAFRKFSFRIGLAAPGLHATDAASAMQKAVGVASASVVFAFVWMMLEASCSLATTRNGKRHVQLVPSWHGPEDSEVASPSQQFGQYGKCQKTDEAAAV